jgi:hypothetical protein
VHYGLGDADRVLWFVLFSIMVRALPFSFCRRCLSQSLLQLLFPLAPGALAPVPPTHFLSCPVQDDDAAGTQQSATDVAGASVEWKQVPVDCSKPPLSPDGTVCARDDERVLAAYRVSE